METSCWFANFICSTLVIKWISNAPSMQDFFSSHVWKMHELIAFSMLSVCSVTHHPVMVVWRKSIEHVPNCPPEIETLARLIYFNFTWFVEILEYCVHLISTSYFVCIRFKENLWPAWFFSLLSTQRCNQSGSFDCVVWIWSVKQQQTMKICVCWFFDAQPN